MTVSVSGGLLVHGQTTGGVNSGSDWDSATAGDQTVPANGTFGVVINGGDGNDALTVLAKNTEIGGAKIIGDGGDDLLTGADSDDSLVGGDGNDRLVGARGADTMSGGAGNDTLVWNKGDGSDMGERRRRQRRRRGQRRADARRRVHARSRSTAPSSSRARTWVRSRSTPRPSASRSTASAATTRSQRTTAWARSRCSPSTAAPVWTRSTAPTGPDLILGGEANDILSGGGGDDRIVGDRGNDTMNGGTGDDTLVWNNGDGTDVANGDDGRDDVEVNGAPAAGDMFTVQPNGARIKFDRTNLVPFSIDIGSSETLHANGLGGNDAISVGEVGTYEVTASGGAGNDTLTGGGSSETFLGGSGNDTITPGGGLDVVFADEGDDQVNVRDRTADVARGGDGNDSVVADVGQLDILDGFEAVDRTPNATPPPVDTSDPPGDHQGRHGEGEAGHSVDQGELPGDLVRQLHRLARAAHRQAHQARRDEGRPPARQRALQHRPRHLEDAQGEAGQGQPAPRRPQGPAQGSRGRLDGPLGQDRAELAAPDARAGHGHEEKLGTPPPRTQAASPPSGAGPLLPCGARRPIGPLLG